MKIEYPYLRKRHASKIKRIEVMADSMRAGKTTAVKVITEGLRGVGYTVSDSYEDWQNNPYLKKSYQDPAKNFLESQKWFIRRKWEQVRDGVIHDEVKHVFIQDVAPEMDFCYALTNFKLKRMSEDNFRIYENFYKNLDWSVAPAPDLLVYLTLSDEKLIERAKTSRREFENVEENYFLTMKRVNQEWLAGVNAEYKVLVVNTDDFDFAKEQKSKARLLEMILDNIA